MKQVCCTAVFATNAIHRRPVQLEQHPQHRLLPITALAPFSEVAPPRPLTIQQLQADDRRQMPVRQQLEHRQRQTMQLVAKVDQEPEVLAVVGLVQVDRRPPIEIRLVVGANASTTDQDVGFRARNLAGIRRRLVRRIWIYFLFYIIF